VTSIYGPDTLDRIAPLWAKGAATAAIGRKLGIPKNSICRLVQVARKGGDMRFPARGLHYKPVGFAPAVNLMPKDRPRRPRPETSARPRAVPEAPVFFPASFRPDKADPDKRPMIYELAPNQCRYPVTLGDTHAHRFCAKPRRPGSPYCPEHHALCNSSVRGAGAIAGWVK
jgi:hypothetical protein